MFKKELYDDLANVYINMQSKVLSESRWHSSYEGFHDHLTNLYGKVTAYHDPDVRGRISFKDDQGRVVGHKELDGYGTLSHYSYEKDGKPFPEPITEEVEALEEATGDDVNRVSKQNPSVSKETIQHYADNADPKDGKGSRYLDWIVKGHKQGQHSTEDSNRIKTALSDFDQHKHKLDKKDINQYNHISEVEENVAPYVGKMSETQKADPATFFEKPDFHEKIFDNGAGLKVYHTKTADASKAIYGGGHTAGGCHTSWCTAGRSEYNRFDHYSKNGENPLYQIHTPDGKVYQDEFSGDYSGGLRDAADRSVDRASLVKEHPDLAKVPAFQGKDVSYSSGPHLKEALHKEIDKGNIHKVLAHPETETEHLNKMVDVTSRYGNRKHMNNILNHPKADESTLNEISKLSYLDGDGQLSKKLFNHPKFNATHVDTILGHEGHSSTKNELRNSDIVTKEIIDKAVQHPDVQTRGLFISHPLATDEQREHIIKNDTENAPKVDAFRTIKSPELIDKLYDEHKEVKYAPSAITSNPNTASKTLDKVFDELSPYEANTAVQHKNASKELIHKQMGINAERGDKDSVLANLKAPNIEKSHIDLALRMKHHLIKQAALRSPAATNEHIDAHISDPSFHGSISVSKAATPEHLATLATSPHQFIRLNVATNKNTSKETLKELTNDQDEGVSSAANKLLKKKK